MLTGELMVIDLRREGVLDALRVDDRISTGRSPDVWAACQQLTDRAPAPHDTDDRGAPRRVRHGALTGISTPFRERDDLLDELIVGGLAVGFRP